MQQEISKSRSLKSLNLIFAHNKLVNIENIENIFTKLNSLITLKLDLSGNSFTEYKLLINRIRKNKYLETLELNLSQIKSEGVSSEAFEAIEELSHLKHLRVVLDETDVKSEEIVNSLKNFKNLDSFNLSLNKNGLSNEDVDSISEQFFNLKEKSKSDRFELQLKENNLDNKFKEDLEIKYKNLLV